MIKADGFDQTRVFTDFSGLEKLKSAARDDDPEAIRQIAKQFEGILVKMMMQSMREASRVLSEDSLFSSNEMKFYEDMMDQQLSLTLTKGRGLGIGNVLTEQLQGYVDKTEEILKKNRTNQNNEDEQNVPPSIRRYNGNTTETTGETESKGKSPLEDALPFVPSANNQFRIPALEEIIKGRMTTTGADTKAFERALPSIKDNATSPSRGVAQQRELADMDVTSFSGPEDFVAKLYPVAKEIAEPHGIDPKLMVAQAALETGWGQFVMQGEKGSSFNLFGIKASGNWSGDSVRVESLEYEGGEPALIYSNFRAYNNFRESFEDYVQFLKSNPRYENALMNAGDPEQFARELQSAGYATDPEYANKISRIFNYEVIQTVDNPKVVNQPTQKDSEVQEPKVGARGNNSRSLGEV